MGLLPLSVPINRILESRTYASVPLSRRFACAIVYVIWELASWNYWRQTQVIVLDVVLRRGTRGRFGAEPLSQQHILGLQLRTGTANGNAQRDPVGDADLICLASLTESTLFDNRTDDSMCSLHGFTNRP